MPISGPISAGDEVILFDPSYDSYDPAIRLNGGVPVHLNLSPPNFSIDWHEVKRKITSHTKMIMVNTKLSAGNTNSFLFCSTTDTEHLNNVQLRFNLFMAKFLFYAG